MNSQLGEFLLASRQQSDGPHEDASGSAGFGDMVRFLRRRRWFLLGWTGTALVLASLISPLIPERYRAESVLVFERSDTRLLQDAASFEREEFDLSAIETEMDVIETRLFVGMLVDSLGLAEDSFLLDEDGGVLGSLKTLIGMGAEATAPVAVVKTEKPQGGGESPANSEVPEQATPGGGDRKVRDRVITALISHMEVIRNSESLAVAIRVTHPDPARAAEIANAVGHLYIEWSLDLKREAAEQAYRFFSVRAERLAKKIAELEREVLDFADANDLASSGEGDVLRKQISAIGDRLATAVAERAVAKANLEQAMAGLEAGTYADAGETSPLLLSLRAEVSAFQRSLDDLSVAYGPQHPEVRALVARGQRAQRQVDEEVRRIVDEHRHAIDVSSARVDALTAELSQLEARQRTRRIAEIQQRETEGRLLFERRRYEELVQSLGSLGRQIETLAPSARFLSEAETPQFPSRPNRPVLIAGATLGAAAVAFALALLLEGFDTRIRSVARIREILGAPGIAQIPRLQRRLFGARPCPVTFATARPGSPFADELRALLRGVLRYREGRPVQVVLVGSSLPGECAPTVAAGLAATATMDGRRTILVDLTLAQETVAGALGLDAAKSRADAALDAQCRLDECIVAHPGLDDLDILLAGPQARRQVGMLSDRGIKELFAELRGRYDMIVVHGTPLLISNDAELLAGEADALVLAVRWGVAREETLRDVRAYLRDHPMPLAGAAICDTDEVRHASRHYGGRPQYRRTAA